MVNFLIQYQYFIWQARRQTEIYEKIIFVKRHLDILRNCVDLLDPKWFLTLRTRSADGKCLEFFLCAWISFARWPEGRQGTGAVARTETSAAAAAARAEAGAGLSNCICSQYKWAYGRPFTKRQPLPATPTHYPWYPIHTLTHTHSRTEIHVMHWGKLLPYVSNEMKWFGRQLTH